ncbi:MAG TPA: UvrD-helicase domain-containing protein [Stellaceae bacterium]|nr:UvrD-helicase domain-containing protein [Stellaceae bacterium]
MEFRIADTFTDALARLTAPEQKAAKLTAFELQLNPTSPGPPLHKLERVGDSHFWSLHVNDDIRLILHRSASSLLLIYVGHHDGAHHWAKRRKIERHPVTGAMQLVEIRDSVQEPAISPAPPAGPPPLVPKPFEKFGKPELMSFGVPEEWVDEVRKANESTLLEVAGHLPQEAQEALLRLAAGEKPEPPLAMAAQADPFTHPDAARRFRIMTDVEELERALDAPWEKWTIFLHPDQRSLVERSWRGPARISGSAGTGKTIVALHRVVHLARRSPEAKLLLTTFSHTLANALQIKLRQLAGRDRSLIGRVTIRSIRDFALMFEGEKFGYSKIVYNYKMPEIIDDVLKATGPVSVSHRVVLNEWTEIVDAWNLRTWEQYRDIARLGRKTRLGTKQREELWTVFTALRAALKEQGLVTYPDLLTRLSEDLTTHGRSPFDHIVADEAQDLSVAEMRFLASLAGGRPDSLLLAGDLGQRIFQTPFSWRALGIDLRGRSHRLRINYRTSHQIRAKADRLLPSSITDMDGIEESRRGTVSLFNGPSPEMKLAKNWEQEIELVAAWIGDRRRDGYEAHEIAIFVRAEVLYPRARKAVDAATLLHSTLGEDLAVAPGKVLIGTMNLAKGLEFRAVVVMACDAHNLPYSRRIETVADESDLEEVYNTERHLLYVACTRARDRLLVTGVTPASEFLADLGI